MSLGQEIPLIVKSPYFQSWHSTSFAPGPPSENGDATVPSNVTWPTFWNGKTLQWTSRIRVDNVTYQWLGQSPVDGTVQANATEGSITPTRTIVTFEAGSVGFNTTFLSPITPSDLVRQSLPFGYIYIDAWSLDGNPHSIQMYFDTTGEILSNSLNDVVHWNTTLTGNIVYHQMALSNPEPFFEEGDIVHDATLYLAMDNKQNMSWEIGFPSQANNAAPLSNNDGDATSRPINNGFPVLAFKVDLGRIIQTNESVVWAMGLVRDPAIQDTSFGRTQLRRSYYWSAYESVDDIIQDVIGNFDDAKSKSINLDNRIITDSAAISFGYDFLLALSLRMTFGAMDITIGNFPNGTMDSSDVKIFMKDIGIRVNPVEVLYASLPAILYVNSSLAGLMLKPLLEYQNSTGYSNAYAAPDLGQSYPNVTGNSAFTEQLAIESCSNMLIMMFAHASKSGDGTLLNQYYDLLNQWALFLEHVGLDTTNGFETSDGDSGPYLSNLVLKGILGLYAMSKISDAAGRSEDSSRRLSLAQNFTSQWKSHALSSGHITSVTENTTSTWGLTYNLYAAKLLSATTLIDDTVYTQESQFYASQIDAAPQFGFPYLENGANVVKSHWTMFTAAAMANTSVNSSLLIEMVFNGIVEQRNGTPYSSYDARTDNVISGVASPAHGAMFALLALNLTDRQISGFSSVPPTSHERSARNVGAIAGGTIAGVVGLCIVLSSVFILRKWGIKRQNNTLHERTVTSPFQVPQPSSSILTSWARTLPVMSKSGRKTDILHIPSPEGHIPTPESSTPVPGNGPNVDILTAEVERLRREMEEMRNERIQETEPPPLYDYQSHPPASANGDHATAPPSGSRA